MSSSKNKPDVPTATSFRKSLQKVKRPSFNEIDSAKVLQRFPSFAESTRVKLTPLAPLAPVKPSADNSERKKLTLKRTSQLQRRPSKDNVKTEDTLVETARTSDRLSFKPQASTQDPLNESFMFTSFYKTESNAWVRPSDYLREIKELNLLNEGASDEGLEIKLSDNLAKNLEKVERLFKITDKWNDILRRAVFYTTSQKTNSDKLSEELKYWRELAAKFDSLEYEFNNEKTKKLEVLMETSARIKPEFEPSLREFQRLKEEVVGLTRHVKRVQLCFEERLAAPISGLEESSSVMEGISLLRQLLVELNGLYQEHHLARNRQFIVNRKINLNAVKRLLAGNLSPSSIANPSLFKQHFLLLDQLMSFFSHFLSALEGCDEQDTELIGKVEYQRLVVLQLSELRNFSEYLQKHENGKAHAKELRSVDTPNVNIFDPESREVWEAIMNGIRQMQACYTQFLAQYD